MVVVGAAISREHRVCGRDYRSLWCRVSELQTPVARLWGLWIVVSRVATVIPFSLPGKMKLRGLMNWRRTPAGNVCFCTLAIHGPYRQRARLLVGDVTEVPWVVLTDEPEDFAGLRVRVIRHEPTGPMAVDFLEKLAAIGNGRGQPAYHDKRFALEAALKEFDTAIFVDADTRFRSLPELPGLPSGIAGTRAVEASIVEHLSRWGTHRKPVFEQLAVHLTGTAETLNTARWVSEALFAITKDGNESRFFEAWARAAEFLHSKEEFTGEGGCIGLAAACAGWTVNYDSLTKLAASTHHEGHGPKSI